MNDIENIIPFVLVGILYVLTGPALGTARLHFQIFTGARFLHTIVYQVGRAYTGRVRGRDERAYK